MFLKFIKVLQKSNQNLYFFYFLCQIILIGAQELRLLKEIMHVVSEKEIVAIPVVLS